MNRQAIRVVLAIQIAAAALCFAVEAVCKFALHLGRPYDRPIILNDGDFFPDFSMWIPRYDQFHSRGFFREGLPLYMYPAPAALLYEPFAPWGVHRTIVFVVALFVCLGIAAALFARGLTLRGMPAKQAALVVSLGVLLSYPIWFEIERGNIELFIWCIAAAGVWAFYRGRGYSAAACFGIIGAIKLYPAIYLGLLIPRRQYKQIAFGLGVLVVVTAAALWLLCPDVPYTILHIRIGLAQFRVYVTQHYIPDLVGFDHSLFALYKRFAHPSDAQLVRASRVYTPLIGLFGLGAYVFRIRFMPMVNQVTALTAAMVCFSPVSFDYTLLHLYTPLCLLLLVLPARGLGRVQLVVLSLLALSVSFMTEFISTAQPWEGQIKAVLLLSLFVVSIVYPITAATTETVEEQRTQLA